VHGAAPDIAGQGIANPVGAILSVALLARHHWGEADAADAIERAVGRALADGLYTPDIAPSGVQPVSTEALTAGIVERL
jgi:3-isopropylmalate dehydrogenase